MFICRYRFYVFIIILLVFGAVLIVQALWLIDFAMWYGHAYIYFPFGAWGIKLGKGDAVNIAYWEIIIGLILSIIGLLYLSRIWIYTRLGRCRI